MSTDLYPPAPPSRTGEPAWEIAKFFPMQGAWSESDYYALETDHFVELVDGHIEVLPMPTLLHQMIVEELFALLNAWARPQGKGRAHFAPVPIRLFEQNIREPDLFYISAANTPDRVGGYPDKVDCVMEVVSEGAESRKRDYEVKRRDYAKAGVPEYWIVDPCDEKITVLFLNDVISDREYTVHGEFSGSSIATSAVLSGFSVDASKIWMLNTDNVK